MLHILCFISYTAFELRYIRNVNCYAMCLFEIIIADELFIMSRNDGKKDMDISETILKNRDSKFLVIIENHFMLFFDVSLNKMSITSTG